MKLHENASGGRFVCNLDWLQLPCGTARGAGHLHVQTLFLQNRCDTKANAV
jgi:hypothetical protein